LKIAIFSDVGAQFSRKTHRLIMIDFRNSTPSYDRKLYLLHCLKRRVFVMVKPIYGLQLRQVMPEVTRRYPTPDEQIERADRLIEQERQRADRLAAQLRALGIEPK
jgi:hypothetical protein